MSADSLDSLDEIAVMLVSDGSPDLDLDETETERYQVPGFTDEDLSWYRRAYHAISTDGI
jgi:hypothetical protein